MRIRFCGFTMHFKHTNPLIMNSLFRYLIILFFIPLGASWPAACLAQDTTSSLGELKNLITDVSLKNGLYNQSIQEKNGSCIVSVKVINTDKQDEEEYEFNFSDLNEYKVNLNATKRSLNISCETSGGKKVIRVYENGSIKGYTNSFTFYASDVENGKSIKDHLEKCILSCRESQTDMTTILGGEPNLDNAINFLKENTKKVSVNDEAWDQQFSVDEAFKAMCSFDVVIEKDGKNMKYNFNAMDINPSTIDFNTKSEFVLVSGQTKGKKKLIEVFENGEKENYVNSFDIYIEDVEEARKYKAALELYTKEAEKLKSNELSKLDGISSLSDLNAFFKSNLTDIAIGDFFAKQTFDYDEAQPYLATFSVDQGELETYKINMVDINENSISFDIKGDKVPVEIHTNDNLNLIQYNKGGEAGKYLDKITIWADDIEAARVLEGTLKKMVIKAKETYQPQIVSGVENPSKEQCVSFLENAFTEVVIGDDAYKLKITPDESNPCKLTYEEHDVTKDKTFHYTFDMQDINNYKTKFNSKGQLAMVYLEIKGEKKLIEISEQGSNSGYTHNLELKARDIENARLIAEAFQKLSLNCTENNN